MFPPKMNFNRTYLGTDHDIFRGSVGETAQFGFDSARAITEGGQKGSPVTKTWLLSNLRFGPPTASPPLPVTAILSSISPSPLHTLHTHGAGTITRRFARRSSSPSRHPGRSSRPSPGSGSIPSQGSPRRLRLPLVIRQDIPSCSQQSPTRCQRPRLARSVLLFYLSSPFAQPPLTSPPPVLQSQAKSTLSRLNASPAEKAARQKRLTAAVRTVLECIGEDPDREGLLRTPERYAQALMWMTKGYEERLPGRFFMPPLHAPLPPLFFFSRVPSIPTPKD